jgi:uncharacterized protein YggT (Ycf19 family)
VTALLYVLSTVAKLLISVSLTLMTVRAVMSWFFSEDEDIGFVRFVYAATEPLIYPVRRLLSRIPALMGFPIDLSFMITYFLLVLLRAWL